MKTQTKVPSLIQAILPLIVLIALLSFNVSYFEVVRFFAQYADVIVLAREVVLEQVMEIHRRIVGEDLRGPNGGLIKIEMFAHGALCMAASGKCYLSLY